MNCLFFHKWDKWKQYEQSYSFMKNDGTIIEKYRVELRQIRKCFKCNKTEDFLV